MSETDIRRPRVAVVVLNYNGLDDTLKCLESLRHVDYPSLMTILVDNGSRVDPEQAAKAISPALVVHKTGSNLGYAGGNNCGLRLALDAAADFILVLNNDTVVHPSIVSSLLEAFRTDEMLAVVGPVINFMEEPDVVMTDGVRFNPATGREFFERLPVPVDPTTTRPVEVDIVNGCCMMFRATALAKVGLFDESFFIVHEESDLCLRMLRAGYRCGVLGRSLVWHKGSSSFDRSGRQFQRYFDTRNLFFLLRRHAGHVPGSRRFPATLWSFSRYASYRYEIEREAGKVEAARAVAEGLADALSGRTGPYLPGRRPMATAVGLVLSGMRQLSRVRRQFTTRAA